MTTDYLKQIFTDYLEEKNTQYAILLNGEWGCGKTFYWKNEFYKIAEENNLKVIYISLNGISDIKLLEKTLFYKLIPFFGKSDNKYLESTFKLIGNAIDKVGKHFIDTDLNDIFKGVGIDTYSFENYIICFDDLERCQIPIKEVLGFINNFIEHKKLKSIILSDESKISKDQTYYNIKEKVIERTINFEPDIKYVVHQIIEKYKIENTDYYKFLLKYEKVIADFFINFEIKNIRIITFYLKSLHKIHPSLNGVEKQYILEILFFTSIISNEFKLGRLISNDTNSTKGIQHIDMHFPNMFKKEESFGEPLIKTPKKEEPKSYARIFYETYLTDRISDYFFYPSIYRYILSGHLKKQDLDKEIKNRYPEVISDEVNSFRKLLNYRFRELSNAEFTKSELKVRKYATEGKYYIYDYVQIAKFYYFFSDNNLIDLTIEDINSFLYLGLSISKKRKEINDTVFTNLMHFGDEDSRITDIKKNIKDIHNSIKNELDEIKAKDIIDIIKSDNQNVLVEYFADNNFSKTVFQYLDVEQLSNAITATSNKQLFDLTEILGSRYTSTNIGEFLFEDYEPLKELRINLVKELDVLANSNQKFLLLELCNKLELICNHLKDTAKK
jgi:hypothetical protein